MFSTFTAKFSYGHAAAGPSLAPYQLQNGSGGVDPAVMAAQGYTYNQSSNIDDGSFAVSLGFTFYIYGSSSTNIYVGSNSYITLGSGSAVYAGLSLGPNAVPNGGIGGSLLPTIHLRSGDHSYQRGWSKVYSNKAIIRYEGTTGTSGIAGVPNLVYEATFYKSNGSYQYIQFNLGTYASAGSTGKPFGVTDGKNSGATFVSFSTMTENSSFYIRTDASGNNPTKFDGIYVPT